MKASELADYSGLVDLRQRLLDFIERATGARRMTVMLASEYNVETQTASRELGDGVFIFDDPGAAQEIGRIASEAARLQVAKIEADLSAAGIVL